jgi:hypothetical protein
MKQSREFCWLLLQIKPAFRLHLGSYLCIVITSLHLDEVSTTCDSGWVADYPILLLIFDAEV